MRKFAKAAAGIGSTLVRIWRKLAAFSHYEQNLKEALRERRLVCDGAMGTELMRAGLEQGGCGEMWNLTHPERVLTIQARYVEAGADCIITNTFGGNRLMLTRHHHAEDLAEINRAAARIAREAF